MKVLDARVEWMEEWDNEPVLKVLVDKIPTLEELVYIKRPLGSSSFLYAEKEGYVHYLYADPCDVRGFGGRAFTLMVRGEPGAEPVQETFWGPWSSRAGVVNRLGFGPCIDVSMTDKPEAFQRGYTFSAGTITLGLADIARGFASIHAKAQIVFETVEDGGTFSYALSSDQSGMVSGAKNRECHFVPRKKMTFPHRPTRQELIMLKTYKAITGLRTHIAESFIETIDSELAREASTTITLIERYFNKFYGSGWREHFIEKDLAFL